MIIGRAAVSGLYRRVVGVNGAQSGKTDTVLDVIGQRLEQRPTPILYVGPSNEFNRDRFEPRLRRMIDECEGPSDKLMRGRREKKTLKTVAGVRVRLASAASSTSLKSDPAGFAIVDECDEMLKNIRGQRDPLGLVEARGDTYADFCTIITSTPGQGVVETEEIEAGTDEDGDPIKLEYFAIGDPVEIESPIWRLFQEGTRNRWAWNCPNCGVPVIRKRKPLHWAPGSTPVQAAKTSYLLSPNNGCIIEDNAQGSVKSAMNAGGFMIAPGQTIEEAILLSFAQFEREMTGERIRDKIAASKAKGMWMGGVAPLGYEVHDRKLVIVNAEAKRVRHIFQRFIEIGSATLLAREPKANEISTKQGRPIDKKYLYRLLNNRIYIGEITHKGNG